MTHGSWSLGKNVFILVLFFVRQCRFQILVLSWHPKPWCLKQREKFRLTAFYNYRISCVDKRMLKGMTITTLLKGPVTPTRSHTGTPTATWKVWKREDWGEAPHGLSERFGDEWKTEDDCYELSRAPNIGAWIERTPYRRHSLNAAEWKGITSFGVEIPLKIVESTPK